MPKINITYEQSLLFCFAAGKYLKMVKIKIRIEIFWPHRWKGARKMTECKLLQKADLPLEAVIILIAGMTMLIAGVLLFPVSAGLLPYHENGLYGLLLVMFALQIITLGKTPFGDMRRSKFLLAVGVAIASAGIITGVIPDLSSRIPRLLLFLCFGPGGLVLLLQMLFDKGKLRAWVKYGGFSGISFWVVRRSIGFSLLIAMLLGNRSC